MSVSLFHGAISGYLSALGSPARIPGSFEGGVRAPDSAHRRKLQVFTSVLTSVHTMVYTFLRGDVALWPKWSASKRLISTWPD